MKKLISLIASLSLVATMFTTAYAAELANNNPVLDTTVTELTSDDLFAIVEETIPEGQKAYLVDINVTGLDLSIERYDSSFNGKKGRKGVVIQAASYDLINLEGEENLVQVYQLDDGTVGGKGNFSMLMNANDPTEAWPTTTDSATTAVTAGEAHFNTYIVFTTGEVKGTVNAKLKISGATYDTATKKNKFDGTKTWDTYEDSFPCTVNGEEGFTVTFGASEPDPQPPVVEKDIVVVPLENKLTHGYAWDVTINKFDTAATYRATFTSGSESKFQDLTIAGEAQDAKVSFAAIMKTAKTNVLLDVAKN